MQSLYFFKLDKGSEEEAFAKNTLWTKHEEMHLWPQSI